MLRFGRAKFASPFKVGDAIFKSPPDVQLHAYLDGGEDGERLEFNGTTIIRGTFLPDFGREPVYMEVK